MSSDLEIEESIKELRPKFKHELKEKINTSKNKTDGHDIMFRRYRRYDKWLGFPVMFFTAITATSLIGLYTQDNPNKNVMLTSIILSSLAFVISTTQKFLNYTDKYHKHDTSSKLYNRLNREIKYVLRKNHIDADKLRDLLGDVDRELSLIEEYEEPIPYKLMKKIEDAQKKKDEENELRIA